MTTPCRSSWRTCWQPRACPPTRLLLELTESTLASAGAGAETELLRVQQLGVGIALDDFGSGYSSLEYLGRLPIDVLKIDRSLVERVHEEPQRQEVMRAIGHIAEKLSLQTIVEGVEHESQRSMLLSLGFERAQGFLFSRAVPLAEAMGPFPGSIGSIADDGDPATARRAPDRHQARPISSPKTLSTSTATPLRANQPATFVRSRCRSSGASALEMNSTACGRSMSTTRPCHHSRL